MKDVMHMLGCFHNEYLCANIAHEICDNITPRDNCFRTAHGLNPVYPSDIKEFEHRYVPYTAMTYVKA